MNKKNIICDILKVGLGIIFIKVCVDKNKVIRENKALEIALEEANNKKERLSNYYEVLSSWLKCKDISLKSVLESRGMKRIAIYGMGEIGGILFEGLLKEGMTPEYIIDQCVNGYNMFKYSSYSKSIEINKISFNKEEIDVIIVTPVFQYDLIRKQLIEKTNCKIMSLSDLLEAAEETKC